MSARRGFSAYSLWSHLTRHGQRNQYASPPKRMNHASTNLRTPEPLSIGALILYVPDRVFDPQIRPQMEREFFEKMHTDLDTKIMVLRSFEEDFTGRDTNARIERLQEEASRIGPLPEAVQRQHEEYQVCPCHPGLISKCNHHGQTLCTAAC